MPFNPNASYPVRWWNNPRVLPKGAAVVFNPNAHYDNGVRVKAWVLRSGGGSSGIVLVG